jgi:potassium efflux system protein
VPIALATAALAGYYYTAVQLTWRVLATLILALGLLGVRAMVLRWLMLSYRRLALKRT